MAFKTFSDTWAARFEFLSSKHRVTPRFTYKPVPAAAPETSFALQTRHFEFDAGEVFVSSMTEKPTGSATSRFMRKIVRRVLLLSIA